METIRTTVEIRLKSPHVCKSCGHAHASIPAGAREEHQYFEVEYYWQCACESTMFEPLGQRRLRVAA